MIVSSLPNGNKRMAKSPYFRMPYRARYTEIEFRPYIIAIGQIAMAANDLAVRLSGLFWTITGKQRDKVARSEIANDRDAAISRRWDSRR
jgi:hypothetical protein